MLYEKKNIIKCRIIWFSILIIGILIPYILYKNSTEENDYFSHILIISFLNLFIFIFAVSTLLLSYKRYEYNGNDIIIYAGFYHHYLKVNGEIFDEHNTSFYLSPLILSSTLDDGTTLYARISTSNRISLKINNKIIRK